MLNLCLPISLHEFSAAMMDQSQPLRRCCGRMLKRAKNIVSDSTLVLMYVRCGRLVISCNSPPVTQLRVKWSCFPPPPPPRPVLTCWPSWCLGGEVLLDGFTLLVFAIVDCELAPPRPVRTCWPSWCLGGEVSLGSFKVFAIVRCELAEVDDDCIN
jgi:hypothetical protein